MASDSPRNHKVAHDHQQYSYKDGIATRRLRLAAHSLMRRRCLVEALLAIQTWFCETGIITEPSQIRSSHVTHYIFFFFLSNGMCVVLLVSF